MTFSIYVVRHLFRHYWRTKVAHPAHGAPPGYPLKGVYTGSGAHAVRCGIRKWRTGVSL